MSSPPSPSSKAKKDGTQLIDQESTKVAAFEDLKDFEKVLSELCDHSKPDRQKSDIVRRLREEGDRATDQERSTCRNSQLVMGDNHLNKLESLVNSIDPKQTHRICANHAGQKSETLKNYKTNTDCPTVTEFKQDKGRQFPNPTSSQNGHCDTKQEDEFENIQSSDNGKKYEMGQYIGGQFIKDDGTNSSAPVDKIPEFNLMSKANGNTLETNGSSQVSESSSSDIIRYDSNMNKPHVYIPYQNHDLAAKCLFIDSNPVHFFRPLTDKETSPDNNRNKSNSLRNKKKKTKEELPLARNLEGHLGDKVDEWNVDQLLSFINSGSNKTDTIISQSAADKKKTKESKKMSKSASSISASGVAKAQMKVVSKSDSDDETDDIPDENKSLAKSSSAGTIAQSAFTQQETPRREATKRESIPSSIKDSSSSNRDSGANQSLSISQSLSDDDEHSIMYSAMSDSEVNAPDQEFQMPKTKHYKRRKANMTNEPRRMGNGLAGNMSQANHAYHPSSFTSGASSSCTTPSLPSASSAVAYYGRGYESEKEYATDTYRIKRVEQHRRKSASSMPHSGQNSPDNSDVESNFSVPSATMRRPGATHGPAQCRTWADVARHNSFTDQKSLKHIHSSNHPSSSFQPPSLSSLSAFGLEGTSYYAYHDSTRARSAIEEECPGETTPNNRLSQTPVHSPRFRNSFSATQSTSPSYAAALNGRKTVPVEFDGYHTANKPPNVSFGFFDENIISDTVSESGDGKHTAEGSGNGSAMKRSFSWDRVKMFKDHINRSSSNFDELIEYNNKVSLRIQDLLERNDPTIVRYSSQS